MLGQRRVSVSEFTAKSSLRDNLRQEGNLIVWNLSTEIQNERAKTPIVNGNPRRKMYYMYVGRNERIGWTGLSGCLRRNNLKEEARFPMLIARWYL